MAKESCHTMNRAVACYVCEPKKKEGAFSPVTDVAKLMPATTGLSLTWQPPTLFRTAFYVHFLLFY